MRCLCSIFKRVMLSYAVCMLLEETALQTVVKYFNESHQLGDPSTAPWWGKWRRGNPVRVFVHPEVFTHREIFIQTCFHTEKLSHTEAFTPRRFCNYTDWLIFTRSEAFTWKSFCTEKFLHKAAFAINRKRKLAGKILHRSFRELTCSQKIVDIQNSSYSLNIIQTEGIDV